MKIRTKIFSIINLFSFLFILLAGTGLSHAETKLDVPGIEQEQSNWCWAASSQAILHYYGTDIAQCDIVNYGWERKDCCMTPSSPDCDKGGFVGKTTPGNPDVLGHWGINNTYVGAALTQANCVSEINAGRPIAIIWQWSLCSFDFCRLENTHAMVVDGYDLNGQYLNYMDPDDGEYHKKLYTWVLYSPTHEWIASHRLTTSPKPNLTPYKPSTWRLLQKSPIVTLGLSKGICNLLISLYGSTSSP